MAIRSVHTPKIFVMTIDELLQQSVASVGVFATPDKSTLLALPHALPGQWEKALALLDPQVSVRHPHMHIVPYDDVRGASIATWHHGSIYQTVISGRPETILRHVNLTENERERYLLECTKQNSNGREVIAVASRNGAAPIESISALDTHRDFVIAGSIAAHRSAEPAALAQLRKLQQGGTHVILVSREHPGFIEAFGKRHALFSRNANYLDAAEVPIDLIESINISNLSGIGHCTSLPLKKSLTAMHAALSQDAQTLLY